MPSLLHVYPRGSLNARREPLPIRDDAPHAIVIGAGFGGLAAAIRLLVRGYRVTVVERLDQAGGRARVFVDDGHVFDAGPTLITAPFLFEELWQLAGRDMRDDVRFVETSPFYRIRFDDGDVFDYTGSADAMRAEVGRISPGDVEGYERFVEMSRRIFEIGFERLGHVAFGSPLDMARIAPAMVGLESYRSVYGLVAKYVKHPKIRQVLSFHPLLVGGNPFSTTSIYSLIAFLERHWGVHFAMGGTGSIVRGLVGLIEGLGGELRLGTEVRQILLDGKRAVGVEVAASMRSSRHERLTSDIVVSNADSAWTYRYLVPPSARKRWTDRRLDSARYSMGLFVWYFGTSRRYEDVAHHTILLGPRYRGLLEDIFERKILARDFSLYLHRPTATDPAMAPSGCDTFYVLSPVPHLDGGVDWAERAEPYRTAIAAHLAATVLPRLEAHLTASRVLHPQNFHDDYLSLKGAGFGLEPVLTQSAYLRPHNRSEDIENLYLVGAGTHPGGGMPGVLSSARVLDTIVPDADAFRRR
jgi:phytoene desaturase